MQALRTKYANLGLTEKTFGGVADYLSATTTDENIETAISGVEPMLKAMQGEADSIRTRKSELEKKLAELEARAKEGQPKQEPQTDPILSKLEEYLTPIIESNKLAMQEISALKSQTVHKTYAEMAEQRLKDKVVKEFYTPFLSEKTFTSEADVESFASQMESVYKVAQQSKANEALGAMGQPGRGNSAQSVQPTNEQLDAALEKSIKF